MSFASFLILTPFAMKTVGGEDVTGVLSLDRLGAKGMFIGMIAAFLAIRHFDLPAAFRDSAVDFSSQESSDHSNEHSFCAKTIK